MELTKTVTDIETTPYAEELLIQQLLVAVMHL